MEQILNYIKPELLLVSVVLYFIGIMLKSAEWMEDKYIPTSLGVIGIFICALWVSATSRFETIEAVMMAVFTAITQGILVAGLSTYVNQIIKQGSKEE